MKKPHLIPRRLYQETKRMYQTTIQTSLRRTDRWLGVHVFGGTQRLSNHLQRNEPATNSIDIELSDKQEQVVSEVTNPGFTVLDASRDEAAINDIRKKFNRYVDSGEVSYRHTGPNRNAYRIGMKSEDFDFAKNIPEIEPLLTDNLLEIIRGYYEGNFRPTSIRMWKNHHVPEDIGAEVFSDYWHVDELEEDVIKIFIYLTDVTEKDGPFRIVSFEDSKRIQKNTSQLRGEHRHIPNGKVESEVSEIFTFTGDRGSTAIGHTTTNLHRASIPAEGHERDLLQLIIRPSDNPLPEDWLLIPELQPEA